MDRMDKKAGKPSAGKSALDLDGKKQREQREYEEVEAYVVREYGENKAAYISGYFSRRAKADDKRIACIVLAALAANLLYQFALGSVFSADAGDAVPDGLLFALKVFALATGLLVLGATAALVQISCWSDRRRRKLLLLEEHVQKEHGYTI